MTFEWDRGRWHVLSRHAMVATAAGRRGIACGVALVLAGVPVGMWVDMWTRANWSTDQAPQARVAFFLMGLLACAILGMAALAGGWHGANAHIGRITDQTAELEDDVLSFGFRFAGKGLPDARHIVHVDLDPERMSASYDSGLHVVTFTSPGDDTSIRHTYTREFSRTGTAEVGQVQYLASWSFPDDLEPSLVDVLTAYGFDLAGD